jgi:hypothetical protein
VRQCETDTFRISSYDLTTDGSRHAISVARPGCGAAAGSALFAVLHDVDFEFPPTEEVEEHPAVGAGCEAAEADERCRRASLLLRGSELRHVVRLECERLASHDDRRLDAESRKDDEELDEPSHVSKMPADRMDHAASLQYSTETARTISATVRSWRGMRRGRR